MVYIIGSLNTRRLTGVGTHDIDILANIILSEHFDIIALQEVYNQEALEPLKSRLMGWEVCHGRPDFGRFGDYGFAFLWNTKRVRECSKDGKPEIITVHSLGMTRKPFYGRFTPCGLPGGLCFEIRLINVHLCWSSEGVADDKSKRFEEFKMVTGRIYNYLSNHRYGNYMPAYTIVLGDYNLSAIICQEYENTTINHYVKTKQIEKTTISAEGYANDYDHFSFNEKRFVGIDYKIQRVDSVNKYMNGDLEQHIQKVSDHVPIKMEFTLK